MSLCPRSLLTLSIFATGLAIGCGGNPPPPPPSTPTTPTAAAKPTGSGDAGAGGTSSGGGAVNAAALDKMTGEEAKSGTCDAEHKAALEKLLDDVETNVRAKTDDGKPLKIESFTKRTQALGEAAKGIQLTLSGRGTQVHVIAFSSKEVSMDVLAGKEAATTMRSPYQRDVTGGPAKISLPKVGTAVPLESDSRQIEMKPGTPLEVRMRGQGCAGVVIFSKS